MSRILEALRRIETNGPEEASVLPGADAGEISHEETDLPRGGDAERPQGGETDLAPREDGAVDDMPSPIVGASVEVRGDATDATPSDPPPETQVVYSLEEGRALREDACAGPQPDPRFTRLADLVVRGFPPGRHALLMLTSPGTGDGKTSVTAALAEALAARTTGAVLAVDGHFEHPQLALRLKSDRGSPSKGSGGLAEVLAGEAGWQSLVRRTPWKRLDILPGMKIAGQGSALMTADLGALFEELRCNYQFVLLDAPSLACPETMSMARHCDGVLVVVKLGRTGRRAARHAVSLLQNGGVHVLGCVVTNA